MALRFLSALLSFVSVSFVSVRAGIQCLDALGHPTDSWTIIKAPKTGDKYLYATQSEALYAPSDILCNRTSTMSDCSDQNQFVIGSDLNSTTRGALAHTLQQLWAEGASYVLFNDEPPGSTSYNFTVGHTKGILATDGETGFYLVHSLPKFPQGPAHSGQASSYSGLPSNTYTYGQNLYCASFPLHTLDTMAYAFQLNLPLIYDFHLEPTVAINAPNISALVKGKFSTDPICATHSITTLGGAPHLLFAKSTQWNQDLWSDCVAPKLQTDLVVESWIRGSAIGPSCSSSYTVQDAEEISFEASANGFTWSEYDDPQTGMSAGAPFDFSSKMDHSKWASSLDGTIACHGDINRMTTQFVRGGGALCFKSSYNLASAVSKENSC